MDYKVNSLEVNWHLDKLKNGIEFTWKAMIMQPDFISINDFQKSSSICKKLDKNISYDKVNFESIDLGDYNNMNDTMYKMQGFAKEII